MRHSHLPCDRSQTEAFAGQTSFLGHRQTPKGQPRLGTPSICAAARAREAVRIKYWMMQPRPTSSNPSIRPRSSSSQETVLRDGARPRIPEYRTLRPASCAVAECRLKPQVVLDSLCLTACAFPLEALESWMARVQSSESRVQSPDIQRQAHHGNFVGLKNAPAAFQSSADRRS
jgi:hypothetical protein